jgi:hypothetical protein
VLIHPWFITSKLKVPLTVPSDGEAVRDSMFFALSGADHDSNIDIAACVGKKQRHWTPWVEPAQPEPNFQGISTATTLRLSAPQGRNESVEHHWIAERQ